MRGFNKTVPVARPVAALLTSLILLINLLPAQSVKQNVGADTVQTRKSLEPPIRYSGVLYRSGNHRDPFLNPLLYKKQVKADEEIARGVAPPGIAGTYISQAALQGIAIREDERVAVVRAADRRAYFIREGDRLFDGYVKAIEIDFITLIRETKMRSGKTFTQEIIKRLRTP